MLKLVTGPTKEPVGVDEAKDHLRITRNTDDETALVRVQTTAARRHVEEITGRAFLTQTWKLGLDAFPCDDEYGGTIELPKPPLISVDSITYVDTNGVTQTLSSSLYTVDAISEPARVVPAYGTAWPSTRAVPNAVIVQFTCGYSADPKDVPEPIKQYIRILMATMFAHREKEVTGTITQDLKFVRSLIDPFRVQVL